MTVKTKEIIVSVVSNDIPLIRCELGTRLFIKKDKNNKYDSKAMSVFAKHKKTGKWTFIGYIANNKEYIPIEGVNNHVLYDVLAEKDVCNGTVVEKMDIIFPYGQLATALVTKIIL